VARATRAFHEYAPLRPSAQETERIYRKISYGPLLDIFVIDMRSYRGPNTHNRQTGRRGHAFTGTGTGGVAPAGSESVASSVEGDRFGHAAGTCRSATAKTRRDGRDSRHMRMATDRRSAGSSNWRACFVYQTEQHPERGLVYGGRTLHGGALLRSAQGEVHGVLPFWEFVSGPMHAGTFGPSQTDDTFGIEVKYAKAPPKGQSNLPPSAGMQFFGEVRIDGRTRAMTVTLRDLAGAALFTQVLEAAPTARL
jgi:alkaline phosphatase D